MKNGNFYISKKTIFSFPLVFFILFFLFLPQPLLAIMSGQMGIRPAYPDPNIPSSRGVFNYSLVPGTVKEDAVEVINTYEEELRLKIYPVDAATTTDGNFALQSEEATEEVGGWVKVSETEITIPPGTSKIVPFTITIPPEAEPGDHMGGIVIQKAELPINAGAITIINRVGVRIYERVPGDIIKDLEIKEFKWNFVGETEQELRKVNLGKFQSFLGFRRKVLFIPVLHNKGTIRLEPKGNIAVVNMFGKEVISLDFSAGMIFPKKEIAPQINWLKDGSWPLFGRYRTTVAISYDDQLPSKKAELVFWAIPYPLLVIIGILIALAVIFYLYRLLIREVAKKEMEIYIVKHGDTLITISEQFRVKWKKLAKINFIKKPYHLSPGQELFIPSQPIFKLFVKQVFRKKRNFWILITVISIFVLALGGWIIYQNIIKKKTEKTAPTPTENQLIQFKASEVDTRDRTRKADLKKIQRALEVYHTTHSYPVANELIKTNEENNILYQELVIGSYIEWLPIDPLDPKYFYGYKGDGETYELTCVLENIDDPEGNKIGDFNIYKVTSEKK